MEMAAKSLSSLRLVWQKVQHELFKTVLAVTVTLGAEVVLQQEAAVVAV
jgi:hypothetical protein